MSRKVHLQVSVEVAPVKFTSGVGDSDEGRVD